MRRQNYPFISLLGLVFALIIGWARFERDRFRYRFEVTAVPDLSRHIALMEERVRRQPDAALDRAVLSSYYAALAKQRGDVTLYDRAESLARESLGLLPFSNPGAKLTLARVAEARHHFREAISLAHEVEREGHRVEPLGVLITSHLALGEITQAAAFAEELARAKPSLMTYALNGLVLAAQGKDAEAERSFRAALQLEDVGEVQDSAWVRAVYARHCLKQGNRMTALALLRESLRIVPQYHFALDLLGQRELQEHHYEAAKRYFDDAFASSKQVIYLRHSAEALALSGNRTTSETLRLEEERLLRDELASGEYGHRLELSRLLLDRGTAGDRGEAIRLAEAEWRLRPSSETGYVLVRALAIGGDWARARNVMQKVLASGVKDARYFQASARIEEAVGNSAAATRYRALAAQENSAIQKLMEEGGDGPKDALWF